MGDEATQAADCCTVAAGVLAVVIAERGEAQVRAQLQAVRMQLNRRRSRPLLALWDLTESMALQIADLSQEERRALQAQP